MRRQVIGVAVLALAAVAWLAGTGAARTGNTPYILQGPVAEPSAWTTPASGWDWSGGAGSVTTLYHGNGAPEHTKMTWKMPTAIGPEGSKGSLTISASAGGETWAPGFSVNGPLVGCDGIKNTRSYGTGCADGDHAAVATSLQPGHSATVTQEFLIKPGLGKVTVTIPGYQQQFTYTAVRNGSGGSGSPGSKDVHLSFRFSASDGMTSSQPIIKFFGTGGFSVNHVPHGNSTTSGTSVKGTGRIVLYPLGPKTYTTELTLVAARYSVPNGHRTMTLTYKVTRSTTTKCGAVGAPVVIEINDQDALSYKIVCGQRDSRFRSAYADVSISGK